MRTLLHNPLLIGSFLVLIAARQAGAAAPAAPQGVISSRGYLNIAGTAVANLTASPKFPNSPDVEYYPRYFEWNPAEDINTPANNAYGENYGAQIIGYFYPPANGDYVFWLAADDGASLFLSSDADPANKKLIAEEAGWSNPRSWETIGGGSVVESKNSQTFANTQWATKDPAGGAKITLQAGRAYYIEALVKEEGGGDNLAVAVQAPNGSIDATLPIPGMYLASFDKTSGPVKIVTQPSNQTIGEGQPAAFSVVVDGTPPYAFQWRKNGTAIADATNRVLSISRVVSADNAAKFSVAITGAQGNVTSADAVLTVTSDTVKPTIAAVIGSDKFTELTVTFSEPVTPASAGDRANYALDGGLTISAAAVVNPTTVLLTTSRQTSGTTYKLTVNNVKDSSLAANAIQPNSAQNFVAFASIKGGLKFEAFYDIAGAAIQGLLDDPKFQADTPDLVAYTTQFTSRLVFADSTHENYGGRISGWLVPTETAQYEFFIRSDDASQLFLSPDDNPANAAQIAEETGCCNAFGDPGAAQTSAPVSLTAGRRYYIYAIWKEGGGGDYCDVAWRKVGDTAQARTLPYIQGNVLETYATPGTFNPPTVAIATPAGGSVFDVGTPVPVTVTVTAASGKTITKVEYLETGRVIANSSTSPFSVTLSGLTEDAHVITARATDSAGLFVESAPISIAVGGQREKITLVAIDDKTTWRYDRSGQDLGTAWREKNFDDSKWPQGKALIADESTTTVEPIRTPISRFNDANEYVRTFFYRTKFTFTGAVSPSIKLQLRHVVDDGAVFYLNGTEINRFGIAAGTSVDYLTDATGHENAYEGPYDIPATLLVQGENVLSAEVHQSGGSSSDMVFGAELVATVPIVTTVTTLVAVDDKTTWRYDRSGQDLGTAWKEKNFDDSKWPQGKALIADESTTTVEPIRTAISRFNDANEYVRTFFFRTHFTFPGTSTAGAKLKLRHVVDDGVVLYLNGVEINRLGIAAGTTVDYLTDATGHENAWEGPYDIPITSLLPGDNVLAAEVHQSGGSSSDMVFGAELVATITGGGTPAPTAAKFTKIARNADGSITLEWSGGGTLQAGASVTGPWQDVAGATSPYTLKPSATSLFGRIKN